MARLIGIPASDGGIQEKSRDPNTIEQARGTSYTLTAKSSLYLVFFKLYKRSGALPTPREGNQGVKTNLGQMDGNDWEEYCHKLLSIRHDDYQKVPAQFGGDYGIEGFRLSAGIVFQCYCPDDDPCGIDLYEKQRDKITKDINKLIRNADKIVALGAGTIKEWHFLTPDYNNRALLSHCRQKELEVGSKGLSAIHDDFTIMLKVENDYISEQRIYLGPSRHRLQPSTEELPYDELEKILKSDNEIVSNIKTKLGRMEIASRKLASLTTGLVSDYVVGQNELENLNEKLPSTYKNVVQLKAETERQLPMRILRSSDNHGSILHEILEEYENRLKVDCSQILSTTLIMRLSSEAVSDWLGRCPLDPNPEGGDETH